jgi:hypothetical protein
MITGHLVIIDPSITKVYNVEDSQGTMDTRIRVSPHSKPKLSREFKVQITIALRIQDDLR